MAETDTRLAEQAALYLVERGDLLPAIVKHLTAALTEALLATAPDDAAGREVCYHQLVAIGHIDYTIKNMAEAAKTREATG